MTSCKVTNIFAGPREFAIIVFNYNTPLHNLTLLKFPKTGFVNIRQAGDIFIANNKV